MKSEIKIKINYYFLIMAIIFLVFLLQNPKYKANYLTIMEDNYLIYPRIILIPQIPA